MINNDPWSCTRGLNASCLGYESSTPLRLGCIKTPTMQLAGGLDVDERLVHLVQLLLLFGLERFTQKAPLEDLERGHGKLSWSSPLPYVLVLLKMDSLDGLLGSPVKIYGCLTLSHGRPPFFPNPPRIVFQAATYN
jgi:hypothetical protein